MDDENKTTLTLPQLCARLRVNDLCIGCHTYTAEFRIKKGVASFYCQECSFNRKILSVGDKIEMDECECGHSDNWHYEWHGSRKCKWAKIAGQMISKSTEKPCLCADFKPLLRTVRGIKFVDGLMCECGQSQYGHLAIEPYGCKQFKPVQMVEITIEKKED